MQLYCQVFKMKFRNIIPDFAWFWGNPMSCYQMPLDVDLFQQLICQGSDVKEGHIFKLLKQ